MRAKIAICLALAGCVAAISLQFVAGWHLGRNGDKEIPNSERDDDRVGTKVEYADREKSRRDASGTFTSGSELPGNQAETGRTSSDAHHLSETDKDEAKQGGLPPDRMDSTSQFLKNDWKDSGFQTIPALIETYYWAMREGDFARWMQCMSPKEQSAWQLLAHDGTNDYIARFESSLEAVVLYQIESITEFHEHESIVIVKHAMTERAPVIERFAVLRIGTGWKIAGEEGFLHYTHHPADVSRFDASERKLNTEQQESPRPTGDQR